MNVGELEVANVLPVLVGAIALFIVLFFLYKTIKGVFYQSAYLETLREFAKAHEYKKPISKWMFIFMEIAGLFLGLLFISSFFKNTFLTVGVIFILLVISVFFGVKFYVPPFKAFALAENLKYETLNDDEDVITGKYNDRDILLKMKKVGITPTGFRRFMDQEGMVNLVKRILSVSMALNDEIIKNIRYKNGKVTTDPEILTTGFSKPEKMLGDIPVSDNARLYISTINGRNYLTMEKININFLFTAELYYIREIMERILDSVNNGKA